MFDPFLDVLSQGNTPNPDIGCNSYIKFGAFHEKCDKEFGKFDYLAFGHYAQTSLIDGKCRLLRGKRWPKV